MPRRPATDEGFQYADLLSNAIDSGWFLIVRWLNRLKWQAQLVDQAPSAHHKKWKWRWVNSRSEETADHPWNQYDSESHLWTQLSRDNMMTRNDSRNTSSQEFQSTKESQTGRRKSLKHRNRLLRPCMNSITPHKSLIKTCRRTIPYVAQLRTSTKLSNRICQSWIPCERAGNRLKRQQNQRFIQTCKRYGMIAETLD
jgi:hypothetical protein